MRKSLLLLPLLAAGCNGHVADYIGSRSAIIAPELPRFGLDLRQSECMAETLGETLNPKQLRLLTRSAGAARTGYFDPARLTLRDLIFLAGSLRDQRVAPLVRRAAVQCGVSEESTVRQVAGPTAAAVPDAAQSAPAPAAGTGAFDVPASAARPATWLNLGSAGSGQAIAVDGPSIEQQGERRAAWFRMVNPGAPPSPAGISYRLRIDCTARTIEPLARRRHDDQGAVSEYREYAPGEERPVPIEGGTVTEIAYLSLCT